MLLMFRNERMNRVEDHKSSLACQKIQTEAFSGRIMERLPEKRRGTNNKVIFYTDRQLYVYQNCI